MQLFLYRAASAPHVRSGLRHRCPVLGSILGLLFVVAWGLPLPTAAEQTSPSKVSASVIVAADGSGDVTSIQEALDQADEGDTILIRAGSYREDVTVHGTANLRVVGEGMDQVHIHGLSRVGTVHIGKWPYGVRNVEITGLTIHEHGGLGLGIFNGGGILLRDIRVKGMVFAQQANDIRIEQCVIGGSLTTGASFSDAEAVLVDNTIHDNDHGVSIAGKSDIRLEKNLITRSLFEGIIVTDRATASIVQNTIVKNGGGIAFHDDSDGLVTGNIIGLNAEGVILGTNGAVERSYNALANREADYLRPGGINGQAPDLQPASDLQTDPGFVDPSENDFRLRADSPLREVGSFPYLGAFPPVSNPHENHDTTSSAR